MKDKRIVLAFVLTALWYLISFLVPYNTLADSLGKVNLGNGRSWPVSFFLMDAIVMTQTVLFIPVVIRSVKKKQYQWLLFSILLLYPLITVWATFQDLVFSPIVP